LMRSPGSLEGLRPVKLRSEMMAEYESVDIWMLLDGAASSRRCRGLHKWGYFKR
jgi:hypothetical protein